MKRTSWIAVMFAAAMLSFGLTITARAEMKSVTLGVGMYCPSCSFMVRQSLKAVPGVMTVIVSLQTQSALVVYDNSDTEVTDLVAATERIGYEMTVLSAVEARTRDPRIAGTSSRWGGDADDALWIYLRSLWSEADPDAQ